MRSPSVHDAISEQIPSFQESAPVELRPPAPPGDLEHPPGGPVSRKPWSVASVQKAFAQLMSEKVESHLRLLFSPGPGLVLKGFDGNRLARSWQAEAILRQNQLWPPREGQVFVVQIDQDSPPPPPPIPRGPTSDPAWTAWNHSLQGLHHFITRYTGQTVAFRAQTRDGAMRLVELNAKGPWSSASHPGQLAGGGSCNGKICGMAWLRPGAYPYQAKFWGSYPPVSDTNMRVARDLNGDGAVDASESAGSQQAFGFGILLHPGFPSGPRSTGCQTFPPADFEELRTILAAQGVETFTYVLARRPNDISGKQAW